MRISVCSLMEEAVQCIWYQLVPPGLRRWSSSCLRFKLFALLLSICIVLGFNTHRIVLVWTKVFVLRPEPKLTDYEKHEIATDFSISNFGNSFEISLPAVKIIHFMYKGYVLDAHFKPLLQSWRKVYPDYKILFWTDTEIDLLISRLYPAWQHMYNHQLSNYMERSDAARAFILHAMGGWYADLDTGCLSRADGLASRHALILPLEPYLHALNNFRMRRLVSNAIMYSVKQHPFWMFYLHRLRQSLVDKKPKRSTMEAAEITGPVLLTYSALMFRQANNGLGCPGPWCPHLPPPVQFLPLYDSRIAHTKEIFRDMCTTQSMSVLKYDGDEFMDECHRLAPFDYNNLPLSPTESFAYHEFYHLNQRKKNGPKVDARKLGLGFVHGTEIVAEIQKLQVQPSLTGHPI